MSSALLTGTSEEEALFNQVSGCIGCILKQYRQPSAWELLQEVEECCGLSATWVIKDVLHRIIEEGPLLNADRNYLSSILSSPDFQQALLGERPPRREIQSTIDGLFNRSLQYRNSAAFQEMIDFMGRFKEYAPFNNMLVKLQNPACGFYATAKDWDKRFGRTIKEDARPMLILAPMHPVILVYDLDQTEGKNLPQELQEFVRFEGISDPSILKHLIENAETRDLIKIDFKTLSSTNAGFATTRIGPEGWKRRIVVHEKLDTPSRLGVLFHELAHVYLGHLRGDADGWWPSRENLKLNTIEVEAEAVVFIVAARIGLKGTSHQYVSRYMKQGNVPAGVSLDLIAKVAGRIEEMTKRKFAARKKKVEKLLLSNS